ncbi:hypothetical protein HGM15179_006680 [Zosterops borbonicus]|uniref:Uncharacterized protein n=1 Tax=Zosterops borbonicus TaxID=364589 RepID=A0A8K1LNG9_9PASS|nr:hypothetical protein HGM15179_006680 [Zosterops borbonicus]
MAEKKSLEAAKHLDQMLSELERHREMEQRIAQMAAHPIEGNDSVPAPVAGHEEMPHIDTDIDMDTVKGDMLGKSDINPASSQRIICPQDVRRSCMIGTVVTLFTVPLSMVLCYVGFQWWKAKKRHPRAAPASGPRRHDSPSPPESPKDDWFDSSQTWPQQQKLPKKAEPPPRPPSPTVKRKSPEIPPPPPLPSPPPWSR